jgi:hypothetical protein
VIAQPYAPLVHAADNIREKSMWKNVLELNEQREPVHGSALALCDAIRKGADLRIGTAFRHNEHIDTTSQNSELIREHMDFRVTYLLDDLGDGPPHEVFVHVGPCYHYTRSKFLIGAANPLVRVRPAVPLVYRSRAWDFGWVTARTDGFVARWLCDPYTLQFAKSTARHAVRWFVDAPQRR